MSASTKKIAKMVRKEIRTSQALVDWMAEMKKLPLRGRLKAAIAIIKGEWSFMGKPGSGKKTRAQKIAESKAKKGKNV